MTEYCDCEGLFTVYEDTEGKMRHGRCGREFKENDKENDKKKPKKDFNDNGGVVVTDDVGQGKPEVKA